MSPTRSAIFRFDTQQQRANMCWYLCRVWKTYTMWHFLPDVQPPKSKVKNTAEKREANKKYVYNADTRKRGFVESWSEGREWLEFSKTSEKMRCKVCRLHPRNNGNRKAAFFIGTSLMRIGNVTSHKDFFNVSLFFFNKIAFFLKGKYIFWRTSNFRKTLARWTSNVFYLWPALGSYTGLS